MPTACASAPAGHRADRICRTFSISDLAEGVDGLIARNPLILDSFPVRYFSSLQASRQQLADFTD
jgi:hypothetical protein